MPRDFLGRDTLAVHFRPALLEPEMGARHEDVLLAVVEGEHHRLKAQALGHGRGDRLEEVVERPVAFEVVGDFQDLVERFGALAVALGEHLDLRADGAVLEDEGDVVRDRPQRGEHLGGVELGRGALDDEEPGVELEGRKTETDLVMALG